MTRNTCEAVRQRRPVEGRGADVVGLSRESAEQQLGNAGLEVAVNEEESDQRENEVLSQIPAGAAWTRARG